MLRESSEKSHLTLTPEAIIDPTIDSGVPHGKLLLRFTDAVLVGTDAQRSELRTLVEGALGRQGLIDAAGSVANFEMMNRIADGTGMPVSRRVRDATEAWRARIGLG